MQKCGVCPVQRCAGRASRLVSDTEINNSEFVRDVRNFAARLGVRPAEWLDRILELFAQFDGCIVNAAHQPAHLTTDILLPTDEEIDDDKGAVIESRIRNWLEETFATPVPENVDPHVRVEARERFRIVASILRARFPSHAIGWGLRGANDNFAPIPPSDR